MFVCLFWHEKECHWKVLSSGKEQSDGPHFEDKHTLITKGVKDTKNMGQTVENKGIRRMGDKFMQLFLLHEP